MTTKKHSLVRSVAAFSLALVPVSSCVCEEVLNEVAPRIAVSACTKPGGEDAEPTEDCALPFGNADISVFAEQTFTIRNPSDLKLKFIATTDDDGNEIPGIHFDETAGDGAFEFVGTPPTELGGGLTAEIRVRIRPQFETTISKDLVILSDAKNVPKGLDDEFGEIRIPMTLTGVDNGVPDIEVIPDANCGTVDPLAVDFGNVAVSGGSICSLTIKNKGTRDLVFDSIAFVADDNGVEINEPADSDAVPALRLTTSPPSPEQPLKPTSAENAPLTLRVAFDPDVLGRYAGVLRIANSDPDAEEAVIDIPFVGIGVNEPICTARVKSVNGTPVTGAPSVEPLDDVVLEAVASSAVPSGSISGYAWTLVESGPGSGVVLSNPSGAETQFSFANRRGVDVAGPYKACVVVTDDLGTESVAPCCVDFEAIPTDAFLVQLTWVGDDSDDMDLHVTKVGANGEYCVQNLGGGSGHVDAPFSTCATNDCGYYNCNPDDTGVEWDGVPGRTSGDPSLDIDDVDAFGPENINVDVAVTGSYAFGASFFSGSVPVSMFMRLFIFGQLRGEWVEDVGTLVDDGGFDTVEGDFWEVGIVHFSEENPFNPCVEDLRDGDDSDDCPDFAETP